MQKLETRWLATLGLALACVLPTLAQESAVTTPSVSPKALVGQDLIQAFAPLHAKVRAGVVRVSGRRPACLGFAVTERHVLTKASDVPSEARCELSDGRRMDARVVATDDVWDLALLQVDDAQFTPIELSDRDLVVGNWLVSSGPDVDPLGVGVVSVKARRILKESGFLGVSLDDADGAVRISQVIPDTAAEKAQLQVGDIIASVQGKAVGTAQDFIGSVGEHAPGETVRLILNRGEQEIEVSAALGRRSDASSEPQTSPRRGRQRQSGNFLDGGSTSKRSTGFRLAIQHDTVLAANEIGGPVLDIEGRVVAMNIARGSRTQSLALPASALKERIAFLLAEAKAAEPPGASR